MELKAFIAQVLSDIDSTLMEHVVQRRRAHNLHPGSVQVGGEVQLRSEESAALNEQHRRLGDIVFDLAVTESAQSTSNGTIGVQVLKIGGEKKSSEEHSREFVSRITFTIHGPASRRG